MRSTIVYQPVTLILVYALIHFHPFMHFSKQMGSECSFQKT